MKSTKSIPLAASIIVAAAILTMIGLGIWQLQRMSEKEAMLARLELAQDKPATVWPNVPVQGELPLFRKSSVNCLEVVSWQAVSGQSEAGAAGIAHLASCKIAGAEGPGALVAVGWSNKLDNPKWAGGLVEGMITPDKDRLIRLVASSKVDGLERLSPPSTDSIPNNHLLYAIQWFFFALAAGVIYFFAVRKRMQDI